MVVEAGEQGEEEGGRGRESKEETGERQGKFLAGN